MKIILRFAKLSVVMMLFVLASISFAQDSVVLAPEGTCPANYEAVETYELYPVSYETRFDALIWGRSPNADYSYTNTEDLNAVLTGYTVVGHPELSCGDGGTHKFCSYSDQLNEHFNIVVDGNLASYVADPGDHAYSPIADVDLGVLSAGTHTISFQHAGNDAPINSSQPSVGFSVTLCVKEILEQAPEFTCPADYALAAEFELYPGYDGTISKWDALIWGRSPNADYSYTNTEDLSAVLTGFTVVGHPEVGCPTGTHTYCSYADQLNEHFNILVDGNQVSYVADPGDHAYSPIADVDLGVLSAGDHTFSFQHAGNDAPINSSGPSVGFSVGLCVKDAPEEPQPSQGCTLGFWKNHTEDWTSYSPDDSVSSIFSNVLSKQDVSLMKALKFGGGNGVDGGQRILLKQAVAALLNAAAADVNYPMSTQQIVDAVSAALAGSRDDMTSLAGQLDAYNNLHNNNLCG